MFCVLVCSRLFLCFLFYRFLCLVICVLFRVCLVFILASSVICPLVDDFFSIFNYWGFPVLVCFGFRIVLGSVCVCDAMNANRGSLLTTSHLVGKHTIIKKGSVRC